MTNPPQSDSSHGNRDTRWRLTKPCVAEWSPFPGDCAPAGLSLRAPRAARRRPPCARACPACPAGLGGAASVLLYFAAFVALLERKPAGFLPNRFPLRAGDTSPEGKGTHNRTWESEGSVSRANIWLSRGRLQRKYKWQGAGLPPARLSRSPAVWAGRM